MSELIYLKKNNNLKGRIFFNKSLANITWLKVGGRAECLFIPKDIEDLSYFLKYINIETQINVFGRLSNVLIRDGGISGITILIPASFSKLEIKNKNKIIAGSGLLDKNLSYFACNNNISGFEFLSGIPGNIGGAIAMNAGCYGSETKDIVDEILILERNGDLKTYNKSDINFFYRNSSIKKNQIIVEATFSGKQEDKSVIKDKMLNIKNMRGNSQPLKLATGGSTFKNPHGLKAWDLIRTSGLSGYKIGGAMISPKHNNFLINIGGASAKDFEELGEFVIYKVEKEFGIKLEWEIRLLGDKS